jgi:RHS repeat-associated protein
MGRGHRYAYRSFNYTYGDASWGDLLTAYNGIARTYDEIGNVLTDGTWTYTWQNGRELAAMTDGDTTWSYVYDANGMRTSRTNGTKTYNYVYNGSQLVQMTVGNDTLYFTYGLLGPTTVTWNGTTYYYALNIQGDVVGIFNEDGNPVVSYAWDTGWGYNPIPEGVMASTLGTLNPLRYRGYVYDTETGYYYLQSRYYDPKIGRFINADAFASTGQGLLGNNMYAYCNNNPICHIDPTGHIPLCQLSNECFLGGGGGAGYVGGSSGIGTGGLVVPVAIGTIAVLGGIYEATKEEFKRLSKALVDTAKARYENSQPAIHHVVPQGCPCESAENARRILSENSISVQDPLNLVIINYETHKQIHSSKHGYCNNVYIILSSNKVDVRRGLAIIKTGIAIIALSNGSCCIGIW